MNTVPEGAKAATGWPVVIFNHGFIPPEIYQTTERYVAYGDGFACNGYIKSFVPTTVDMAFPKASQPAVVVHRPIRLMSSTPWPL